MCRRVSSSNVFEKSGARPFTRSHLFAMMTMPRPARSTSPPMAASWSVAPVVRVDHESDDVGVRDRLLGERDADHFHLAASPHASRPPHAGGIHDAKPPPMPDHRHVDRVARRARHLADQHALFPQQPVDERGLPDVRTPDDGDSGLLSGSRESGVGSRRDRPTRDSRVPNPGSRPASRFRPATPRPHRHVPRKSRRRDRSQAGRTPAPIGEPACRRSC